MFEPSKELVVLKSFLNEVPLGGFISYKDVEAKTEIKMNERGKSILRSALRSLKMEYRCDKGNGIEIESDKNTMHIVTDKVKRVGNSLRRADRTIVRMTERYVDQLPKPDRDRLLSTASLFGAIRAMAKGLSNIYKVPKLNTINPSIPDFRK